MRYLSSIAIAALVAAAIPLSLAVWRLPAIAADAQVTTCPAFASAKWVSPVDSSESGNQYRLTVSMNAMSCADATTWAKKLIPLKIGGAMGSHTSLKGGPAGYDCVGFPDNAGLAYRGRCEKAGMEPVPGFSWNNNTP